MAAVRWIGFGACSLAALGYAAIGNYNMTGAMLALVDWQTVSALAGLMLLSRALAELHGGQIDILGTPESGYRYVVSLPELTLALANAEI